MGKNCVFLAISYTKRKKVENAIRSYLENKGLEVITGRDMASGGNLCDEIRTLIEECDFGVVVYNELRHNISYEWGLMDGMKKNVVLFKDKNTHIDLDYELSDKKATNFTPFYGEDTEKEIIQQLKEDKGLEKALEKNIEKRLSKEATLETKKASELLVKYDLPFGELSKEIKELPNSEEILKALGKIKNLTAEGHVIKGIAFYSEGKFKKAIEEYNKAIKLDPEYAFAYNTRGIAYGCVNNFKEAMNDYNTAIKLDPEYAVAYNNRGITSFKLGDFDDAIKDYKKAIELDPEYIDAYQCLAEVYIITDNYKESLLKAHKSLEKSKTVEDITISKLLITISLLHQGQGKTEEEELIEYINQNKGYDLPFECDSLKNALKDSKYSTRINKLIKLVEENAA